MAFRPEKRENLDEHFVKLGKDIVKKCFNVPLAIRVVGSLLHGASEAMWISFRDKELADISERDDTMNKILSLSYHQLDSSLKSCFAYCAIFPKDFEIDKQMLISLWMAQGYINEEYVGEEYFHILLQRCFFQDIKENDRADIISFKMHDLLHDIAEQTAGEEVCRLTSDPDRKVRHVGLLYGSHPQVDVGLLYGSHPIWVSFNKTHIRTCLQVDVAEWLIRSDQLLAGNLITNWASLRSLDLRYLKAKSLPEAIGKLIHLRYLILSESLKLEVLPNSITRLVNLQTLILHNCRSLRELPKDMCKLVDLSTLDIRSCYNLSHMPSKLGLLTNLHTLKLFVVGGESSYEKQCFDGLEDLRSLNNLKGFLEIDISKVCRNAKYVKEDHGGGDYLMSMVHLNEIYFNFDNNNRSDESIEWQQALLEEMQPHDDIKNLTLYHYNGETMPRWPKREDNSTLFYLPNLVKLELLQCEKIRFLPPLENLPRLKKLVLDGLLNVEFVVNVNLEAPSLCEGASFFPCLEELYIADLYKLKGWWPGSKEQNEHLIGKPFPGFAQLKALSIYNCPILKSIPICSGLCLVRVNDSGRSMDMNGMDQLPFIKSLLPTQSKCRMLSVSYLGNILEK